ncbi:CHAT domain-containing protein [Roseivirga misakiensis]|uniref:CHAT domain-containing protein n=1 Tax=Roseivirga misakiensis TaxID=1563681 RepID=A0A1E5T5N3_9BACT|nr:CHAT domain-containing tetratricopeptide repeat protein [Roseivirga misakiensis]OEK06683.1 hypothetical protein BFP71_03190 [Roseivirga misakiensis]
MINTALRFLFILFSFCSFAIIAQEQVTDPNNAIKIARELASVKQYDSASNYFQKTIQLSIEIEDNWNKTLAQAELGRNWIYQRDYEKAKEISEAVLENRGAAIRAKIIAHQNLGRLYARNPQDYDKEKYHNHKALKIASEEIPRRFSAKRKNDSLKTSNVIRGLQVLSYMHRDLRSYDSAQYYMDRIIDLSEEKQPANIYQLAYNQLDQLWLYVNQNRFSDTKIEIDRTQPLIDNLSLNTQGEFNLAANYYNLLDVYYSRTRNTDSSFAARVKQEQIISASPRIDSTQLAQLQTNMGIGYYTTGDINKAFEYEKKALKLKERVLPVDDLGFAASYKMLGIYRIDQAFAGEEATEYFREALRINLKHLGRLNPTTADAMYNLSYGLNTAGKFAESLEVEREVLDIFAEIGVGDYVKGSVLAGIATNLASLDSLQEAIFAYNELVKFSNMSKIDMSIYKVKAESGLGFCYLKMDEYDKALKHFKVAERLLVQMSGPGNSGLAAIYNGISKGLNEQNRLDEALVMIKKAIEVNSYDKLLFSIDPIPLDLLAKKQIQFVDSYVIYTQILKHRTEIEENPDFEEFWKVFNNSIEVIESSISEQTNSADVISLLSANKTLYSAGIDIQWLMDSVNIESQESLKMWQLSEKSKAINQKLKDRKRQATSPLSTDIKIQEGLTAISDQIAQYKSLAINGNDHDSVSAGLFKALQAKKEYKEKIKSDFPRDYLLKYLTDDISFNDVKVFLGPNQVILDYFIAGENLYAFVINEHGIDSFKFDWSTSLKANVSSFKKHLVNDSLNLFYQASRDIYQEIFKPLESAITGKNVIIVPDKTLWNVNFDLLLTNSGKEMPKPNDFLISKYAFSYNYSSDLLVKNVKKEESKSQVLGFSYADDNITELQVSNLRDKAKANLPGTALEVRNLAESLLGTFYFGKQASEEVFKKKASAFSVLHLALHGEVNDKDPDNSKLFFGGNGDLSDEDNTLHSFELYDMNLNAELAVLSACNTGAGKITDGEGIMSLGKAFQYAGVNSVLLSQWEVSDAVAPEIIEAFYKYLKEGQTKAEALRSAKLDFLKTSNNITSNPYYWGSFFILGSTESIDFKTSDQKWFWLLGVSLILVILIFRKRKIIRTTS